MAANGRGYMRPNSGGRAPPFLIIGLLVVIGILAFNYWSLSSKNSTLTVEVDEVEMRYRSTQARKLDVEKRNAELSTQLEDAKKYKQQAQEKDMRLREAEQKEKELNAKIDNLAGEAEVLKNDLNTCDDEVGFCHENITKMIIAQKKALEAAHMNCNTKVDEARSNAEQRAASVESSCQQAVNEMRLTILRMVQQVFGTKAVLILQQEAHADVSGIDLTKITGLDIQPEKQQIQPHSVQQQLLVGQEQQLQGQQQQLQETQRPLLQDQQQPLQEQQQSHLEQQQPLQGLQQPFQRDQQPAQGDQQPAQGDQQPVQGEQQPQLQQFPQEQRQPQLQQPPEVLVPVNHLEQQQQKYGEVQQQLPDMAVHVEGRRDAKEANNQTDEMKESTVVQGLSQTNDLAQGVQEGYSHISAIKQGEIQHQGPISDSQRSADHSVQEHKSESLQSVVQQAPVAQQGIEQVAPNQNLQDHNPQPLLNAVAPTGQTIVRDNVDVHHENVQPVAQNEVGVNLNQRSDQTAYISKDAAPIGQAVGAEIVVAAQQSLSPLSIQVLNEHYQLPAQLDSNIQSDLSRAQHDLKSQLAFSEEKLHLSSLKELLKSASQQSVLNLRRDPPENLTAKSDLPFANTDSNYSTMRTPNIDSSFDGNHLHAVSPSLSTNQMLLDKNSLLNVLDNMSAPLDQDQVEHNTGSQEFGSISMIEDSDSDRYEKAVSKILSKEALLGLPELESLQSINDAGDEILSEPLAKEPVEPAGPKKTFSHGFLYLNLSQLLENSDLEEDFRAEDHGQQEGEDEDLFLDGTTQRFETTTEVGYSTEAGDWMETTDSSIDAPLDRFDNWDRDQREGDQQDAGDQHLTFGQLPKAMDTQPGYATLEDQLRLPVDDNGQDKDKNEEVVPQFHQFGEGGREQMNDQVIEQIPQQRVFI